MTALRASCNKDTACAARNSTRVSMLSRELRVLLPVVQPVSQKARVSFHIADYVIYPSFILRARSPQNDLNAPSRRPPGLETHAYQGQMLFLLLVAQLTDDLKPGGPHLIALAELV